MRTRAIPGYLAALTAATASLAACRTRATPVPLTPTVAAVVATMAPAPQPTPTLPASAVPTVPSQPVATAIATVTDTPLVLPLATPLAPEPRPVTFAASDGKKLQGTYYPGASNPSPLVVLMHWAPGDAHEWDAIALWLQNRGSTAPPPPSPLRTQWLDASWFPELAAGRSYAVFTFTFRECEGGCKRFLRDLWLLDAQSALEAARSLDGVDPARVVAVGASIGADGAIDSCAAINEKQPDGCLGAFSLSPGDYLTVSYAKMVTGLGAVVPPRPAWCLYATGDKASAQACTSATGTNYRIITYDGDAHGMSLIARVTQPSVLELLLDFLETTLPSP